MGYRTSLGDEFVSTVLGINTMSIAEEAKDFVADKFEPSEVYDQKDLMEHVLSDIEDYYAPEDVFTKDRLEDWAEENGFVREE